MSSLSEEELGKVAEFLTQASDPLRTRATELREQLSREGPLKP